MLFHFGFRTTRPCQEQKYIKGTELFFSLMFLIFHLLLFFLSFYIYLGPYGLVESVPMHLLFQSNLKAIINAIYTNAFFLIDQCKVYQLPLIDTIGIDPSIHCRLCLALEYNIFVCVHIFKMIMFRGAYLRELGQESW